MKVPQILYYIHDYSMVNSPYGPPFVDNLGAMWYNSLDALKESFYSDIMKYQEDHGQIVYDFHDILSTQVAWAEQFVVELPK